MSKKRKENKISQEDNKYSSAEVLLTLAKERYTQETNRHKEILNRAGLLLSAMIAILALVLPTLPLEKIKDVYKTGDVCTVSIVSIALFLTLIAFIFAAFAFTAFYKVIKADSYQYPNIEGISNNNLYDCKIHETQKSLAEHYKDVASNNAKITTKKARQLNIGLICLGMAFATMIFSSVFLRILV